MTVTDCSLCFLAVHHHIYHAIFIALFGRAMIDAFWRVAIRRQISRQLIDCVWCRLSRRLSVTYGTWSLHHSLQLSLSDAGSRLVFICFIRVRVMTVRLRRSAVHRRRRSAAVLARSGRHSCRRCSGQVCEHRCRVRLNWHRRLMHACWRSRARRWRSSTRDEEMLLVMNVYRKEWCPRGPAVATLFVCLSSNIHQLATW